MCPEEEEDDDIIIISGGEDDDAQSSQQTGVRITKESFLKGFEDIYKKSIEADQVFSVPGLLSAYLDRLNHD